MIYSSSNIYHKITYFIIEAQSSGWYVVKMQYEESHLFATKNTKTNLYDLYIYPHTIS